MQKKCKRESAKGENGENEGPQEERCYLTSDKTDIVVKRWTEWGS